MLWFLRILFSFIFAAMVYVTTVASLERDVFEATLDLWSDAWFRATLADAYFGFITMLVWIYYRERSAGRRAIWTAMLLGLGNIGMSLYVLIELFGIKPGQPLSALFQPRKAT